MRKEQAVINFCFPTISGKITTTKDFADVLISSMQRSGSIDFAGYMEDGDLRLDLLRRLGDFDAKLYTRLSPERKVKIAATVEQILTKCAKLLTHPELPIYIFVFPWFPSAEESKQFGGVNAVAPHSNVLHLFVDPNKHTLLSIKETVAHEYNHLIYYKMHPSKSYTLLQNMLIEGLAENFREDVVGGKPAPWATALSFVNSKKWLEEIESDLNSKSIKICDEVLLGSGKFPRWTGYSIGYHLVKKFKKRNPKMTWTELEKVSASNFLK